MEKKIENNLDLGLRQAKEIEAKKERVIKMIQANIEKMDKLNRQAKEDSEKEYFIKNLNILIK